MTDQPTEGQPPAGDHDDEIIDASRASDEPAETPIETGSPTQQAAAEVDPRPEPVAARAAAPAPAARTAGPVDPPYVAAAKARKRVPLWAVPIFPLLIVWALVYVNAMQPPGNTHDPIAQGAKLYAANCSACHGATGAGSASIPGFVNGSVEKTFPKYVDQIQWVNVGSANWPTATYGSGSVKKTHVGNVMPGFGPQGNQNSISCADIALIVNYERVTLGGEKVGAEPEMDKLATDIATGNTAAVVPNCPLTTQ